VTMRDAVDGVLNGRWSFFVTADGKRQDLQVAVNLAGTKYLKVKGEPTDHSSSLLLSLSECRHAGSGEL